MKRIEKIRIEFCQGRVRDPQAPEKRHHQISWNRGWKSTPGWWWQRKIPSSAQEKKVICNTDRIIEGLGFMDSMGTATYQSRRGRGGCC